MFEFKLNEVEKQKYIAWRKKIERSKEFKKNQNTDKWSLIFKFQISGIGNAVSVEYGPHEIDLTDYGSW